MLDENEGKFKGSLLEELINQLIERLVEEGYLNLKEVEQPQNQQQQNGEGQGEIGDGAAARRAFSGDRKGFGFSRL